MAILSRVAFQVDLGQSLEGLCRNAGVHAAGVIIADQPLDEIIPLCKDKDDNILTQFEGPIAAAMTFYAAGRMYRTDWFRSQIVVREGRIVSLEPSTMPTRRVRQVERKGQTERRREFVQDLAAGSAAEKEAAKPEEKSFGAGA